MSQKKLTGRGGPGRNQGRRPEFKKPMKRVNVMLDEDTLKGLGEIAQNRSEAIRIAVKRYVNPSIDSL